MVVNRMAKRLEDKLQIGGFGVEAQSVLPMNDIQSIHTKKAVLPAKLFKKYPCIHTDWYVVICIIFQLSFCYPKHSITPRNSKISSMQIKIPIISGKAEGL